MGILPLEINQVTADPWDLLLSQKPYSKWDLQQKEVGHGQIYLDVPGS